MPDANAHVVNVTPVVNVVVPTPSAEPTVPVAPAKVKKYETKLRGQKLIYAINTGSRIEVIEVA
jgi:hypothetical protein